MSTCDGGVEDITVSPCALFRGSSGLRKTCLPERGDKQQLAGLLGVGDCWQLDSVKELLLCVAFTYSRNLFAGSRDNGVWVCVRTANPAAAAGVTGIHRLSFDTGLVPFFKHCLELRYHDE
ncbi:hypothetical protein EYF80_020641 [Liparis tanakae]|uniref:Uncharacterized protein n=1 Tax=Liparis tanakae TaxID=230148 RepID=A0A4Z2HVY0_9TELE|nr:hypothetical protein EYF80_020641 [Liparis tanakae]